MARSEVVIQYKNEDIHQFDELMSKNKIGMYPGHIHYKIYIRNNTKIIEIKNKATVYYDIIMSKEATHMNICLLPDDITMFSFRYCKQKLLLLQNAESIFDILFSTNKRNNIGKIFQSFNMILLFNEFKKVYGDINDRKQKELFRYDIFETDKDGYSIFVSDKSISKCKHINKDIFKLETCIYYSNKPEETYIKIKIENELLFHMIIKIMLTII